MIKRLSLSLFLFFALLPMPPALGQNAEELFHKLEKMPAEKRRQLLIDGAKREGSLMIYATTSGPAIDALLSSFRKKHPFLKPEVWREGRGAALADRAIAEIRAGRYLADVLGGGQNALEPLLKMSALARYHSPERRYFPDDYKDKQGYWTAVFIQESIFGFNTNLVDRAKLPPTYFDLLDPYWKGKLVLDPLPNSFVRGALAAYGEKKAMELFDRLLSTQDVQFRRGRTLQTQLLAAGEFAASPEIRLGTLLELKTKGAPVDYHFIYPTPVELRPVAIFKTAPHPHAAALLADFWLSPEGQKIMVQAGYSVAREGIDSEAATPKNVALPITLDWLEANDKRVQQIAKEIFSRRAKGAKQ
ncbi:MAG: ABC transporter substrate-binding protein [Candidatus Binatia bacterium]